MFRVSYIDENDNIAVKSFKDTKEANKWVNSNKNITALKMLVWDENIDCFRTLYEF